MISCPFRDHRNPPSARRCASCGAELPGALEQSQGAGPQQPVPPQVVDEALIALIKSGRKIEAIKRYRERTGAGLAEAKEAVEAIERGESIAQDEAGSAGIEAQVLALLRSGRKILAIKLYREKTGRGLADSKQAVEALASAHGITVSRAGCGGAVLSLLVAAILLYLVMA